MRLRAAGQALRSLIAVLSGCLVLIIVGLIFVVALLDYSAVRRNQVGEGWKYASRDEVISILKRCGVKDRWVVPAGVFFHFGWAWNQIGESNLEAKRSCFDRSLKDLGATAVIYDGMG